MDTLQAVRAMLAASGVTPYRAALGMGRGPTYVSGMLRRGSVPSGNVLASLAASCGWRLVLVPPDGLDLEALTIDGGAPPSDSDD